MHVQLHAFFTALISVCTCAAGGDCCASSSKSVNTKYCEECRCLDPTHKGSRCIDQRLGDGFCDDGAYARGIENMNQFPRKSSPIRDCFSVQRTTWRHANTTKATVAPMDTTASSCTVMSASASIPMSTKRENVTANAVHQHTRVTNIAMTVRVKSVKPSGGWRLGRVESLV